MKFAVLGLGIAAALAGALGFSLAHQTLPPPRQVPPGDAIAHLGPGACAYCHGRSDVAGAVGTEHATWMKLDPHARAFTVLCEPSAKLIEKNLNRLPSIADAFPHENPLCLSCHVQPNAAHARFKNRDLYLAEGVSCESCHGPADKYISEHYRLARRATSAREKEVLGLRDTKSLAGRARLCVDCHVGKPGSDVNHDLLAAGHPPLKFEFAAFHEELPKHWDDAKDRDPSKDPRGGKDFELRAWAAGQLASAEAALNLLAERAGNAKLPWPEFAEYDCAACHHDLKAKSARQDRVVELAGKKKVTPGDLSWGAWNFSIPKALAQRDPKGQRLLQDGLAELETEMAKGRPNRELVKNKAKGLAGRIAGLADTLPRQYAAADLDATLTWLTEHKEITRSGWDGAAQYALALAALKRAGRDGAVPLHDNIQAAAKDLRPRLALEHHNQFLPKALTRRLQFLEPRQADKD